MSLWRVPVSIGNQYTKYWKALFPNVWIVNARYIKNVPGHKTDKMDSEWICKLFLAGLLKPSYIPPKEQRQLRDLTRYRS